MTGRKVCRRDLPSAISILQSLWQTSMQWIHSRGVEGQEKHLHTSPPQTRRHEANLGSVTAPPVTLALGSVSRTATCWIALIVSLLVISLPALLPRTTTVVAASIPEKRVPVVMRAPWGCERKVLQAARWEGRR